MSGHFGAMDFCRRKSAFSAGSFQMLMDGLSFKVIGFHLFKSAVKSWHMSRWSLTAITSRVECIEKIAQPMSTVGIPIIWAKIGPTVLPLDKFECEAYDW